MGEGNDFLDQHPNYNGEKTASDSYFHGGSGDDAIYLTTDADHIGLILQIIRMHLSPQIKLF